jgi:hypothetical protein
MFAVRCPPLAIDLLDHNLQGYDPMANGAFAVAAFTLGRVRG